MLMENKPLTGQSGLYATAAWDEKSREIILKVVNTSGNNISQGISLKTRKKLSSSGKLIKLQANNLSDVNTLDQLSVKPIENEFVLKGKNVNITFAPYSMNVIKIKED
jgi:alpha-N-arabinofuranosidase